MPTLNWIGKEAVEKHHEDVPYRLLEPVSELSCGEADSGNLIVQGDNLHALKALLPRYGGKVKCIYIDPPYNTGNEGWAYNDNVNSPEIRKWLGETVGKEGETLDRHDRWLCMMYPRLVLLKQFLADDGVIFVSIDDNEVGHLRLLMDEIFGSINFISQLVWEKGRKNDAKYVSVGHEYILLYANSKSTLKSKKTVWREKKAGADEILSEVERLKKIHGTNYTLIEEGLSSFYKTLKKDHPSKKHARYSKVDQFGVWRDDNMSWPSSGGPRYDVIHPVTGIPCAIPPNGWRYSTLEKMQEMISGGKVVFRSDHTEPPIRKTYLIQLSSDDDESADSAIQVAGSYFYRSALQSKSELHEIFGKHVFDYPKDSDVLARWIEYVTQDDALILDSFAGSGTTAHAVLKLNALRGSSRRFILVEMDRNIAPNVTAERVKRVSQGYTNSKDQQVEGLGSGFQYCTLSEEPLFMADGEIRPDVTFSQLAEFVWFGETGTGYTGKADSPLLGVHDGRAIYLLYNGILKDLTTEGGNILTAHVYSVLPKYDGAKVIYAAANRLGAKAKRENITFKQTPYKLEV
jgi:adenine-specific DNA-methyltransferase